MTDWCTNFLLTKKYIRGIINKKKIKNPQDNIVYKGRYKKVSVGVYCLKGKLKTIFPDFKINEGARIKAYVKRKNR